MSAKTCNLDVRGRKVKLELATQRLGVSTSVEATSRLY